ncbi:MAG: WD40 repeat domain-containing protein [Solirubrobacterales bacterium]|nr:WD40 repeat domain-containing protein [Solirubrobacterales bacterium]
MAAPDSPYVGLGYYTEDQAELFFGRDAERKLIITNLRAARLTLLYAPSGVGKSSLLRAAVMPRLRRGAEESYQRRGSATHIPVLFSAWSEEPVDRFIAELERAIASFQRGEKETALPRSSLTEAFRAAVSATDATLLVILDQFEEYLLYRPRERHPGRLADELAAAINSQGLRADFLIAVREDAYAGLGDLFQAKLPNVYGNYLHLEYLHRDAAREAIVRPVARFNDAHPEDDAVLIEPELVEAVLDEVRTGQVVFEQAGKGVIPNHDGVSTRSDEIETPYLQLVMATLWERELSAGSRTLRLSTLGQLGGAQQIVRTHLESALESLPEEQREVAVDVFHYLVTPSGTKILHRIPDLASYSGRDVGDVEKLVEQLEGGRQRILRPVPALAGENGTPRVEIFHDVLAPAILAWRSSHAAKRLEREKEEAEQEAQRERGRARIFKATAAVALTLLAIAIGAVIFAEVERGRATDAQHVALSRQLGSQAQLNFATGAIGQGVLLAVEAYRFGDTSDARLALIRALQTTDGMTEYLTGHTATVNSVAFRPHADQLVSGSADGTVIVWNLGTGRPLRTLQGDGSQISSVALSPDGKLLAAGDGGGTVTLWNLATGVRQRSITGAVGSVETVAFSPNGRTLAFGGDNDTIELWDLAAARAAGMLRGHTDFVYDVAFSPSGTTLASASADQTVILWSLRTRRVTRVLGGQNGAVSTVAFSPDGRDVASGSDDGSVILWSASNGKRLRTLRGHLGPVESVAFNQDGSELASGGDDRRVNLWSATTGQQLGTFRAQSARVNSVAFSSDGRELATGSDDNTIALWNPGVLSGIRTLRGHTDKVLGVAVSDNSKEIASAGADGSVMLWSATSGRRLATLRGHSKPVQAVAFSPDGNTLASAGDDDRVILWDVGTGNRLRTLIGHSGYVYGVAFSPDGRMLASANSDHTVILWDTATGRRLRTLRGHPDAVDAVAFSPDGKLLASGGDDRLVILWNPSTGQRLRTLTGHTDHVDSVAFSDDGSVLASGSFDHSVILWDPRSGRQLGDPLLGHQAQVSSVSFLPSDARMLASAGDDGTVMMWDTVTRLAEPLAEYENPVQSVAFSGDGGLLASGSTDDTVRLMAPLPTRITAGEVEQRLCGVVRRNLSRAQWQEVLPHQSYAKVCPSWP